MANNVNKERTKKTKKFKANSQDRTIHSFRERWRRIPFKPASRFLMRAEFPGWIGQHNVKFCPPVAPRSHLTSLYWPRSTKRSTRHGLSGTWSKISTLSSSQTKYGQHWMVLMSGHVDGLHMVEQHQLSSNDSKVEMAWWSGQRMVSKDRHQRRPLNDLVTCFSRPQPYRELLVTAEEETLCWSKTILIKG